MESKELDEDQNTALDLVCGGHNVAIIGCAGTGKSHLIRVLVHNLFGGGKFTAVTASTGMAAINLKGLKAVTIHSFTGILDGRLRMDELKRRLLFDESAHKVREQIRQIDVLIIDEASMISAHTFEQVEFALRTVKDTQKLFGGVQIVAVLDPRQLPPVPDRLYGDSGQFCFESRVWQIGIPHRVMLRTPHRQQDPQMLALVEEVFSGSISQESRNLLHWLSRPLPGEKLHVSTRLCADNFSVDRYNRDALDKIEGAMVLFRADDEGEAEQLRHIRVPKVLALKDGCRVMLLKNINQSKGLVNGVQGTLTAIAEDCLTVKFGREILKLSRETFTRQEPKTQKILAHRKQFPICLSYALTLHKAQGQELKAVEVDARGVWKAGMLGVGISRVRDLNSLRVLNFKQGQCPPPSGVVKEFIQSAGEPPQDNNTCCLIEVPSEMGYKTAEPGVMSESPDSSGSGSTVDLSDSLLLAAEELQGEALETGDIPDSVPEVTDLIQQGRPKLTDTEEQKSLMAIFDNLELARVETFRQYLYSSLKSKITFEEGQNKAAHQTKMSSLMYAFTNSHAYIGMVKNLFHNSKPTSSHFQVASRVTFQMWSHLLPNQPERGLPKEDALPASIEKKRNNLDKHDTAGAKLRYVGGSVLARLLFRTKQVVRSHLYDKNNRVLRIGDGRILWYEQMEHEAGSDTLYPKTLREIEHRRTGRLFIPNDRAYEFFVSMEKERLKLHTFANIERFGSDMPGCVTNCLLKNDQLRNNFSNIISKQPCNQQDESNTIEDFASGIIEMLFQAACSLSEVRTDVITLYMKSGNKQFRGEVMNHLKVKKKEAHRKKIMKRAAAKAEKVPKKQKAAEGMEAAPAPAATSVPAEPQMAEDDDDDFCNACGRPYVEGQAWVSCDGCEAWYERRCAKIRSDKQWTDITEGIEPWLCSECMARL